MNRLIEAVDNLAPHFDEEFFIQTGNSSYIPKNCNYQDFLDSETYNKMIAQSSVLITHAGVGTIISGITAGKPVIVVPRLVEYGEHVDDHQSQIAEAFSAKKLVLCCTDVAKLGEYIEKAKDYEFSQYELKGGNIEETIIKFIDIFD